MTSAENVFKFTVLLVLPSCIMYETCITQVTTNSNVGVLELL